jgi:hypothetical protein
MKVRKPWSKEVEKSTIKIARREMGRPFRSSVWFLFLPFVWTVPLGWTGAQEEEGSLAIVAPGAEVQQLAGGFSFTEGPAEDADGNIYFTDIPNNRIHKWTIESGLSTFREDSGGANGRSRYWPMSTRARS